MALAVDRYGELDVLVNNAGILRDRMIFNMDFDDWDAVIRVHLRGTFAPTRWAAAHWRERFKATDQPLHARLINTTSSSGLFANVGQANYAAAKAGIASFTIVASRELANYGVTSNAIYPTALSRMTEDIFAKRRRTASPAGQEFDSFGPRQLRPCRDVARKYPFVGYYRASIRASRRKDHRGGKLGRRAHNR